MPWFEPIVLACLAGAAFCVLVQSWRRLAPGAIYCAAAVLLLDFYYRGPALQMIPAILAGVLLLMAAVLLRRSGNAAIFASYGALFLVSTSLGLLILLPFFELPRPTGPYAIGTRTLHFYDRSRTMSGGRAASGQAPRELVVQLWYPAADHSHGSRAHYVRPREISLIKSYMAGIRTNAWQDAPILSGGQTFPVILYGHSWGSRRGVDTFLCEDLASHGFVVAAIDHPYNSARIELADGRVLRSDRAEELNNLEGSTALRVEQIWNDELARWVADQRFVLNGLERSELAPSLDFTRAGAFGHSFGGAAALAMLGDSAPGPKVQAAVNLDGWVFAGLERRTTQPILIVYEADPGPEFFAHEKGVMGVLDRADIAAVDRSLEEFGGVEAYVAGTSHLDFTDQTLVSPFQRITYTGPIRGERIRLITRQLVLAFFERSLRGSGAPLPQFPEVTEKVFHGHP
jgi:dienelactone hydrolase